MRSPEIAPLPHRQSLAFVEWLYADYLRDPESVSTDWRTYFDALTKENGARRFRLGPSFAPGSVFNPPGRFETNGAARQRELDMAALQDRVDQLIRAFRIRGHFAAKIDPLQRERYQPPELEPAFYGFTEADLDRTFSTETIHGVDVLSLREIVRRLENTYCRSIGAEFMHIEDREAVRWLQDRMESSENRLEISRREQLRILTRLTDAVVFEEFIQKKYIGAKSFSLEGGESLIPLLDMLIEKGSALGTTEIVLGMAHRGRLNVLANILGKSLPEIFREFEDIDPELHLGRGDVKYHLGYSSDFKTSSGKMVHLSLCFNPSHLEYVNPVALGRMRAKQDRAGDDGRTRGLVVMIHGDAAFVGEGITQELLNLSELEAYTTGGSIHIILNNQIGFTTSPEQGMSTYYTTDIAKMLQIPIFHVNGEDPEAVAQVVQLAVEFRFAFHRDVVIDMFCYRRRGHNETDEPQFTQPLLYKAIEQRKSVREGYLRHLLSLGGVTREEADEIEEQLRRELDTGFLKARGEDFIHRSDGLQGIWSGYVGGPESDVADVATGVAKDTLVKLLESQSRVPDDFHPHPKIERLLQLRQKMVVGEKPLDWGAAEALAFASLLVEGVRIRMSGQDCERGTFSHRHAVLHDYEDGHTYTPLRFLSKNQGPFEIYNSPLSESAVLGFEYGYSLDCPDGLILWEAQFGDFVNVAQVVIDQFIVSAEDKWRRLSGLVLLLPHGFEGSGPEHSSARLERFLTLAAEDNIQVCNFTTPAQYFHALRRQVLRPWRKPLVVMSPKSLLRHPSAVSTLEECAAGRFAKVIADQGERDPRNVARVLLCSGKIYYELEHERRAQHRDDVAILRLEQLYPFPAAELDQALAAYPATARVLWVQEEPENMGAWTFLRSRAFDTLSRRQPIEGVYRPASASPATGSTSAHKQEQMLVIAQAFGDA